MEGPCNPIPMCRHTRHAQLRRVAFQGGGRGNEPEARKVTVTGVARVPACRNGIARTLPLDLPPLICLCVLVVQLLCMGVGHCDHRVEICCDCPIL
eukprot:360847-Chlamydomonas_euryale.AAC.1